MRNPNLAFLPSEKKIGSKEIEVREFRFHLSLTFKANAILAFKLESLDGQEVSVEEATYS